jgi:hypothetical protein
MLRTTLSKTEGSYCRVLSRQGLASASPTLFDMVWDDPDFARSASFVGQAA